jgi:hypothetical protein
MTPRYINVWASLLRVSVFRAGCLISAFVFFSCSPDLSKEAYIEWVRDYEHGLHVSKKSSGFVFDLQYQPSAYVWLQQQRAGLRTGGQQEATIDSLSATQYYTLTVSVEDTHYDLIDYNVRDEAEKQQKLYYFSYLFQDDIVLEENDRTLPCVLFHFERQGDLGRHRTFVLGFESPDRNAKEARLVIRSRYFNSLPIKINVNKDNIPPVSI